MVDNKKTILQANNLYIGIDGGGTNCRARLYDETGKILCDAQSGPANIRLGFDNAWQNIIDAANQCLVKVGFAPNEFSNISIGIGAAGISNEEILQEFLKKAPNFEFINASGDAHIACLGAFDGDDGGIIIIGTGSIGYALKGAKPHRIGGWGFELSDNGSAASIGREGLKACLLSFDGLGKASGLTDNLMKQIGAKPTDIVNWVKGAKPKDFGELAPLIFEFANKNDEIAHEIIVNAAHYFDLMIAKLNQTGAKQICLLGGMAKSIKPWLSPNSLCLLTAPKFDALYGAFLLAKGKSNGF